jgi:calcium-dependent protein kinase
MNPDTIWSKSKFRVLILIRVCYGGELFDEIIARKRFNEKDTAEILRQVISVVAYCHSNNIVHRDLKPENILLEDKSSSSLNVKVIDFGASQICDPDSRLTEKFGTVYYISPEVLKGNYTTSCDIWSIGVIMFILLCGEPPFNGEDDEEIMEKIRRGKFEFSCKIILKSDHL